jgi:hypothetical protein
VTTDTETRNFLGIPIVGDITYGEVKPNQRPLEELTPLIQAVLDDPNVAVFGWEQYTPYFNDGEPCIFSVGGLWADPVSGEPDDEQDDYYGYHQEVDYDDRWGKYPYDYQTHVEGPYEGPNQETYDRLLALNEALQSEQWDDALLRTFGDHAQVVVTPGKILVQQYEHD